MPQKNQENNSSNILSGNNVFTDDILSQAEVDAILRGVIASDEEIVEPLFNYYGYVVLNGIKYYQIAANFYNDLSEEFTNWVVDNGTAGIDFSIVHDNPKNSMILVSEEFYTMLCIRWAK